MLPATSASTSAEAESSTLAYSHISRASAAKAIHYLDSYAFPDTITSSSTFVSPVKRKKVAEVDLNQASNAVRSHFSSLAGLSQLHRERARQRRSERLALASQNGKGREGLDAKSDHANTYQPFSLPFLLNRLSTFSVSTYSSKPPVCKRLGPVALAMQGWKHLTGKERDVVTCITCQAQWKAEIASGTPQKDREMAWLALDESVPLRHSQWCPWRLRGCHASLYRVPVHSRLEILSETIKSAKEFAECSGMDEVEIISSLDEAEMHSLSQLVPDTTPLSCILLSLLGWHLNEGTKEVKNGIIQCSMCSRKVGLWGFLKVDTGSRPLNVVTEHKSFCPFINGEMQSGPSSKGEALNAWQQRLRVLLKGHDGVPRDLLLSQKQVREMRSSEVLAKVKSLMM